MRTNSILVPLFATALAAQPLAAEVLPFAAGDFENSPATHWTSNTVGLLTTTSFPSSGGNRFARISPALLGSGSLTADTGNQFAPGSLYEISVDLRSSNLVALGLEFGMDILDGSNAVVAGIDQGQLLNLLGITLLQITQLTEDLNLLDGALTEDLLLLGTLRDLLESLLDPGGALDDPALLGAVQELIAALSGSDGEILSGVSGLLGEVLGGGL